MNTPISVHPQAQHLDYNTFDPAGAPFADPVVITGVVSHEEQYIWEAQNPGMPKIHYFKLAAWLPDGGKLVKKEAGVSRALYDRQQEPIGIKPCSVVRLTVRPSEKSDRFYLISGEVTDTTPPALGKIVAENTKPASILSPLLGTLLLDEDNYTYLGYGQWLDKTIPVSFPINRKDKNIDGGLKAAETLWAFQDDWTEQMKAFACKKNLKLKNQYWLQPGQAKLTAEQFAGQLTPKAVIFWKGGRFEFHFDAGGMFGTHILAVMGSAKGGFSDTGFR